MQQFVTKTSPYVRKDTSTKRMMIDVLIALIPSVIFAVFRFGLKALVIMIVSILVMMATEIAGIAFIDKGEAGTFKEKVVMRYQKFSVNNLTAPLVSALIYAMLIPDGLHLYVVAFGAFFAIFIGKIIFGGLGHNTFNPAAMGRVFIALAFANFFQGAYSGVDVAAGATPLTTGFENYANSYRIQDLLFGNIPGAMGEVNAIAILLGAAYLFIRKSADFRPALSAFGIFTALTLVAGIIKYPNQIFEYVLFQLLSGGLLFGLTFMITDPVTSPVTKPGRLTFGLIIGTLVFMIRMFGVLPEGVAFALLIGNALVPLLDYPKLATNVYTKKFLIGYSSAFVLLILLTFLVVGGYII